MTNGTSVSFKTPCLATLTRWVIPFYCAKTLMIFHKLVVTHTTKMETNIKKQKEKTKLDVNLKKSLPFVTVLPVTVPDIICFLALRLT